MNNKIAFSGVVILVAGMILALSVAHLVNSHEYEVTPTFYETAAGEYVSQSIDMHNSSGVLYISNNSTNVYLVVSTSIALLNASNAGEYAVEPSAGGNFTSGGFAYSLGDSGRLYSNLTGVYSIVVFTDIQPSIAYDRTSVVDHTTASLYGPLVVAGEVMWIGGTLVAGIGFVVLRKKDNGKH